MTPSNPADDPFPFFRATFTQPHAAGFLIVPTSTYMGNPGPQQNYNPLQDSAVVRYYSIIN